MEHLRFLTRWHLSQIQSRQQQHLQASLGGNEERQAQLQMLLQQNGQGQQQPPQQMQPQIPPQQLMRSQFNIGQNPVNTTNLNTMNPSNLYAQQQAYANLAATQQRQGGLSNLNQPINPPAPTQSQQTPQQRPAPFPQLQDSTLNSQLRNPLQSPAQPQQQVTAQDIEKIAQDIATYKFFMTLSSQLKGIALDPPTHLKDLHDKALQRFQQL